MRRPLLSLAVAVVTALSLGTTAAAHATYVRSTPASDARLLRPPDEILVTWSEEVDPRFSEIAVLDASGARLPTGPTQPTEEPNALRVALEALPPGGYTVSWRVLSTVDAHETRGTFVFAVGDAALPELVIPDAGQARTPGPLELLGRVLGFGGVALIIGTLASVLWLTPPRAPRAVGLVGAGAFSASALLLYAAQVQGVSADVWQAAQGIALSRQGLLLATRLVSAGLVALAVTGVLAGTRAGTAMVAVAVLIGVLAVSLASHAAASGDALQLVIDALHVLAMGAWSGGLAALVLTLARGRPARAGDVVWRFSLLAVASVSLLVLTGVLASFRRLRLVEDLYETPYGIAILVKVLLLTLALGLGARNLLVHGPLMRRSPSPTARRHVVRNGALEIGLVAVVLAATAVLTALVPPAQAATAPFDEVRRVEGTRIGLRLAAATPGRNRFELSVADGLQPADDVERVLMRFTMLTMDMGESELVASRRAPGQFVAEGSPLSMYGPWKVEVIVRRSGRADLRTTFTVPVVPPSGGATAQVVPAPPYALIVFTDPAVPVAGAPFALSVVVTDERGIAVSDASVRARVEGPERLDLGPVRADAGRYALPVAGLGAGAYRVIIVIERGGTAVETALELEVGR